MKFLLLSILFVSLLQASWNPTIKRDSRLEQTILQISSRYNVAVPVGLYQVPYHRLSVEKFLLYSRDSLALTVGEKEDVELLLLWYGGDKTLFSRHNEKARINLNLNLTGNVNLRVNDSTGIGLKGIISPGVNGHLAGLSFASEFDVWTEYVSDSIWYKHNYQPYNGNPFNLFGREDSGNVRASDMFRAGVSWKLGLSHWDLGVDHLKAGPTVRNPLMFNMEVSPMAYARMTLEFPWFTYYHLAGIPQTIREYDRYLMFHRFEVPLFQKRFTIGLNETVVYGSTPDSLTEAKQSVDPISQDYYNIERSFQPVYLIPFMPFAFAEHFSGDRENALISLDFALRLPTNFYWYFEFLLDDMSAPHTLFSDDWGNKWGLAVGGQWYGVVGGKNLTISAEYSRIEPWVYTHFRGSSHRYEHYSKSIGSDMGPNSDLAWIQAEFQLNQKNRFQVSFENQRWNHEQRGGSINHVYISETVWEQSKDEDGNTDLVMDSDKKKFLDGDVQSDQIVSAKWSFLPYHLFEMDTKINYSTRHGFAIGLYGGFRF